MLESLFDQEEIEEDYRRALREEAKAEGREEGREEARNQDIKVYIRLCRDFKLSDDSIIQRLVEDYGVSKVEAQRLVLESSNGKD